ncbi:hypothetical protein DPMN_098602 [Dreissena polymorpha]|uniref:Uncharacterized protein n=1 Tax=Dreissena polymorpha TaxID=45954 RepID=A0A9D4R6V3_DREPO|nr:hypothetical protein DPMN_098602 [Dreissena polymorpha]
MRTERRTGMQSAVDPAPKNEPHPRVRRRIRSAAETASEKEHAPSSVPEREAAAAATPPAKCLRADDSVEIIEVIDLGDIFCTADDLPRGHSVAKHKASA